MTKIYSIEGNIGSGKSTLMSYLKANLSPDRFVCIEEPVSVWTDIKNNKGDNILSLFYLDKKKYSFSFQMLAFISRLSIIKKTIENDKLLGLDRIIIVERSCFTDKNVFAKMLYDNGFIEDVEYQIYLMWFEEFSYINNSIRYIYVNTSPKICYNRISKRLRNGENKIELAYLEQCAKYHNEWLIDNKVLLLDGDLEFENNIIIINNICNNILAFINNT